MLGIVQTLIPVLEQADYQSELVVHPAANVAINTVQHQMLEILQAMQATQIANANSGRNNDGNHGGNYTNGNNNEGNNGSNNGDNNNPRRRRNKRTVNSPLARTTDVHVGRTDGKNIFHAPHLSYLVF